MVERRRRANLRSNSIPEAGRFEITRPEPEEIGLENVLEELADMLKTSNDKHMLSIKAPMTFLPQFQLLMEFARFRKRTADIGSLSCNERETSESIGQEEEYVKQV